MHPKVRVRKLFNSHALLLLHTVIFSQEHEVMFFHLDNKPEFHSFALLAARRNVNVRFRSAFAGRAFRTVPLATAQVRS